MILGIDVSPIYPYIALLVLLLCVVMLWRALGWITNATKVLSALVEQVGTNGKSTLRAELTTLATNTENLRALLMQNAELDKKTNAAQADAMRAQDVAISQMQGLVKILGETMSAMGLDHQIRTLLEAQKAIATTTLNVMNAQQQSERHGGVDVGGSGSIKTGNDLVAGDTATGAQESGVDKPKETKIEGTLKGTIIETPKE